MNPINRAIAMLLNVFLLSIALQTAGVLSAQQMPQDYWVDQGVRVIVSQSDANNYCLPPVGDQANHIYWAISSGGSSRSGLDTNGNQQTIYCYPSQIVLMDSGLNNKKTFGSFWNAQGMTCDKSNNLYVLDSDGRVYVYDHNQNLKTNFLTSCQNGSYIPIKNITTNKYGDTYYTNWYCSPIINASGYSSYNNYSSAPKISINLNNELFVCDFASASVKVFSTNGTYLRSWGGVGVGLTNFATAPWGVQVNPDQTLSVIDNTSPVNGPWQNGANIIKNFDSNGNYLGQSPLGALGNSWYSYNAMPLAISPDGLRKDPLSLGFNLDYTPIANGYYIQWVMQGGYLPSGDLILLQGNYIYNYLTSSSIRQYSLKYLYRNYYGKDLAVNRIPPPLPVIQGKSQRPGTTYLDVDYSVLASTNIPVRVAMLAFINGQTNLDSLIIPTTFVENTQTNLGTNIAPNTTHRVSWNVAQDWSTNTGSLQIEFLANDGRPLQPQMWTYSPTNLPTQLTGTVTDPWSMFLWLLATKDPSVSLQNGTIVGVGGNYNGQVLYGNLTTTNYYYTNNPQFGYWTSGPSWQTTTNGLQFLQDRVNAQVPLVLSNTVAH